ncbi:unnamed protein product [Rotaria sp. Silwood2]|nr:unnamed protein product [Rotaria sp. Silwood2]CAF2840493.1 unnamed protein product [Rotaria sp. Silwood2]CAF3106608.1 unnamed protein product [Rotaria sp. Silwood2]CAF3222677.1 unnamed protein product [Rotaria sp. Silwood2]CAF4575566.1 unnamed protein product [Rotaria sp. Silwood2]
MAKQLSKITNAIENIHLEKNSKESSSSTQADDIEQLFENTITCIPCSTWKKQAPKHLFTSIKSSFGIFQHIEQKVDEPLSQ